MLPPPFGSAPPAIPGIAQPRRRARARRRCVQLADARPGARLRPRLRRAPPHLASCQPVPQARPNRGTCRARPWGLRRHGAELPPPRTRSSRARQLVGCADARPPPGGAALGASTLGGKAGPEGGGALQLWTHKPAPRPSWWGALLCAQRRNSTRRGLWSARRWRQSANPKPSPARAARVCVARVRAPWPACPRYAAGGLAQAACALTEGVPLLRPLAGAAADKLGGPCGGR
jgi:hypothetical protein